MKSSDAAKRPSLRRQSTLPEFLLQVDLVKEWPLPADRLLRGENAADVFFGEIVPVPIDPAHDEQAAVPAEEFLEIEFKSQPGVIDISRMVRMNPAADVSVEDAVVETEHFHSGLLQAIAIAPPIAGDVISFLKAAGLNSRFVLRLEDREVRSRNGHGILRDRFARESEREDENELEFLHAFRR